MKHTLAAFTMCTALVTIVMLLALDKIACHMSPDYGYVAQVVTAACCAANAALGIMAAIAYTHARDE